MSKDNELSEAQYREFLQRIATLANETGKQLQAEPDDEARFALVKKLVDGAHIALPVWQERRANHGVDYMLLKEKHLVEEVFTDKRPRLARCVAIPCLDEDEAEVLCNDLAESQSPTTKH